jgi:hypothetical protein
MSRAIPAAAVAIAALNPTGAAWIALAAIAPAMPPDPMLQPFLANESRSLSTARVTRF